MQIYAFTDGSSRGNPGRGGFGVVLIAPELKLKKEFSMGFRNTTNNRMELLAAITALEKLKGKQDIVIVTDSKYVCDAVNKRWVFNWEKKNFSGKKNPDLWMRFLRNYRKHNVKLEWIKGHAGHKWNERADQLATEAADGENLKIDMGFERTEQAGLL
ncbi:ribonuclease HI [Ornithobacterium rhinotracheale]|uniref:ribonuclease HI n=1 Tax=Ornithobacterium rhinotracheale TaxID=28251 RepID=UPI001FF3665E|nr:ribonuclease HI [Ornithobacterium rhinotracheale]MCK0205485.1 ribonuclease HI [Ornithobacterium rhinotracheale]